MTVCATVSSVEIESFIFVGTERDLGQLDRRQIVSGRLNATHFRHVMTLSLLHATKTLVCERLDNRSVNAFTGALRRVVADEYRVRFRTQPPP